MATAYNAELFTANVSNGTQISFGPAPDISWYSLPHVPDYSWHSVCVFRFYASMFIFLSFLLSSTETTVHLWLHLLSDPDSGHHQDVSPAHGVLRGQSR